VRYRPFGRDVTDNFQLPMSNWQLRNLLMTKAVCKLGIVEAEADETVFWLEFIAQAVLVPIVRLRNLISEAKQANRIFRRFPEDGEEKQSPIGNRQSQIVQKVRTLSDSRQNLLGARRSIHRFRRLRSCHRRRRQPGKNRQQPHRTCSYRPLRMHGIRRGQHSEKEARAVHQPRGSRRSRSCCRATYSLYRNSPRLPRGWKSQPYRNGTCGSSFQRQILLGFCHACENRSDHLRDRIC